MRTELKVIRVKNGWTQKDIADRIGISVAAYSFIESGKRFGSAETWDKIKRICKIKNADIWRIQHEE